MNDNMSNEDPKSQGADASDEESASTLDHILEVSSKLIMEEGVDSLSMRKVARIVGIRLSSLNYYFPTKADLVETCLDQGYELLMKLSNESLGNIVQGSPIPVEVEKLARKLFRRGRTLQEFVRLRLYSTIKGDGLPDTRLDKQIVPFLTTAANAMGKTDEQKVAVRLAIHSLEMLIARHIVQSDRELLKFTGLDDIDAAVDATEEHIGRVAAAILSTISV